MIDCMRLGAAGPLGLTGASKVSGNETRVQAAKRKLAAATKEIPGSATKMLPIEYLYRLAAVAGVEFDWPPGTGSE